MGGGNGEVVRPGGNEQVSTAEPQKGSEIGSAMHFSSSSPFQRRNVYSAANKSDYVMSVTSPFEGHVGEA